jgi:hypothetical protein
VSERARTLTCEEALLAFEVNGFTSRHTAVVGACWPAGIKSEPGRPSRKLPPVRALLDSALDHRRFHRSDGDGNYWATLLDPECGHRQFKPEQQSNIGGK